MDAVVTAWEPDQPPSIECQVDVRPLGPNHKNMTEMGFEPTTSALSAPRSNQLSYTVYGCSIEHSPLEVSWYDDDVSLADYIRLRKK